MKRRKLIVGLTGSFGSGKSTVARMFKRFGVRKAIDCDRLAHEVFKPGHAVGKKMSSLLGLKRKLDRKSIAKVVFSNPEKRRQLEALIHPYVYRRVLGEIKKIASGVVILEVPLLFEGGFDRLCGRTIAVTASRRAVIRRLRPRGFKPREVYVRLQAQLPDRDKRKRADFHIQNSGSYAELLNRVKLVWRKLERINQNG